MLLKRLLAMLLICVMLWPAAVLAETAGIRNIVPILYVSDATGPADALMDDDPSTVWYGTFDPNSSMPTWTVLVSSQTVKEIWIRNGARQDAGSYLAAGRPSLLAVTVYYENQQVATYRYRLNDAYVAESSRDFVNGYQRLLLPSAMRGVFCIELRVMETVGSRAGEMALTDILLTSGQPSTASSNVQMRPAAPTVHPAATTAPTVSGDTGETPPTMPPQAAPQVTNPPTMPPSMPQGTGVTATLLQSIGVRTGPATGYDYVGTYFKGGEQVQVISKVWDPVNTLYWIQVDFVAVGGYHYRGYCVREKRVDVDPALIPDEVTTGTPATIAERTGSYFGPGTDYRAHNDQISAGTKGSIFAWENGYALFEWRDRSKEEKRRAWVPESAVTVDGQ